MELDDASEVQLWNYMQLGQMAVGVIACLVLIYGSVTVVLNIVMDDNTKSINPSKHDLKKHNNNNNQKKEKKNIKMKDEKKNGSSANNKKRQDNIIEKPSKKDESNSKERAHRIHTGVTKL